MAVRFLETDYFKKPFIRSLPGPYKALYLYIICDCNHAGIWPADFEIASIYLGQKVTEKEFKKLFEERFIDLGNGKIFFPEIVKAQYPRGLGKSDNATKSARAILQKYNLLDKEDNLIERGAPEGLPRGSVDPSQDLQEEEKEKEREEEKEKGIIKGPHEFKNSEISDLESFISAFDNTDYQAADLAYYFEVVSSWANGKGVRRKDWIATARGFMLRDRKDGKLVLADGVTPKGKENDLQRLKREIYESVTEN